MKKSAIVANLILNFQFSILNFTSVAWRTTFGACVPEKALSQRLLHLCAQRRAYSSRVIAVVGIVLSNRGAVKAQAFDPASVLRPRIDHRPPTTDRGWKIEDGKSSISNPRSPIPKGR
jgi:hypothetical protein